VSAAIEPDGRCVLQRGAAPQPPPRPRLKIVE